MSQTIVFATYDITPEQWADFAKAAAIPGTDVAPYVLISSHSPSSTSCTIALSSPVHSELSTSSSFGLRSLFRSLVDPESNQHMSIVLFLVLDSQSADDRKVLIVHREPEWVKLDGTRLPCEPKQAGVSEEEQAEYEEKVVWTRFRVPFEEAAELWMVLEEKGPRLVVEVEEQRQWLLDAETGGIEERAPV
ncbi:MAG: hypothetical protein M1821_007674 [Bathelium mastoideum]|nr:MAG: hypothetical protein M1821_007674 [Bathelium mastoideum]